MKVGGPLSSPCAFTLYSFRIANFSVIQVQCRIFAQNYNPEGLRLGNKILRQRLRGPALASWYPRKTVSFRDLQDTYKPFELETWDDKEEDRLEAIEKYAHRFVFLWQDTGLKEMDADMLTAARKSVERGHRRRSGPKQVCSGLWLAPCELRTYLQYIFAQNLPVDARNNTLLNGGIWSNVGVLFLHREILHGTWEFALHGCFFYFLFFHGRNHICITRAAM